MPPQGWHIPVWPPPAPMHPSPAWQVPPAPPAQHCWPAAPQGAHIAMVQRRPSPVQVVVIMFPKVTAQQICPAAPQGMLFVWQEPFMHMPITDGAWPVPQA